MLTEVRTAKNWYRWLWFSPFLTVPTQIVLAGVFAQVLFGRGYPIGPFG